MNLWPYGNMTLEQSDDAIDVPSITISFPTAVSGDLVVVAAHSSTGPSGSGLTWTQRASLTGTKVWTTTADGVETSTTFGFTQPDQVCIVWSVGRTGGLVYDPDVETTTNTAGDITVSTPGINTLLTFVVTQGLADIPDSSNPLDYLVGFAPGGAFRDGIVMVARRVGPGVAPGATYTDPFANPDKTISLGIGLRYNQPGIRVIKYS